MKIKKEYNKDLKKETVRRLDGVKEEFSKDFTLRLFKNEEKYNQMVAQVGIEAIALCAHHHLPFQCTVNIAYIPNKWVMGLSKFARITEMFLNPTIKTIQEKATQQIMNEFKKIKPKGVMVVIKGTHSCIGYRGIRKPSLTITSAVSGVFANEKHSAKSEFLSLIK